MQLRHLRTFVAVASTLSFTQSAKRLHLAQSSVTEQMQALETQLRATLFDRSGRKLALTAAGRRLLDYAREILALSDEARAQVSATADVVEDRIAIGGLETLCAQPISRVVAKYVARCPEVHVTLRSGMSSELRERMKAGELDVYFGFGAGAPDPELLSEPIADETLVVIAAAEHRLARRSTVTMDDLLSEKFAVTDPGCVYRKMFDDAFIASRPERPRLVGEFGSMGAIRAVVEQGLGCAFVPKLVATQAMKEGAVVSLPHAGPEHSVPVTMHWRPRIEGRRAIQLFLDEARASFREASH